MRTGRPRRIAPARRFNLTLDESDLALLIAYSQQAGHPPTRVAGDLLRAILRGAKGDNGQLDSAQVEATLRLLRGESDQPTRIEPRWEWPIEAILADSRWWERWLPDLNELLGRKLQDPKDDRGQGRRAPVRDRRGYADLMEFLFPACEGVSWRSPKYPHLASARAEDGELYYVWESVIRHVATALEALEAVAQPGTSPAARILTQDQITGPWLRTLKNLVGEVARPADLPQKRLA
jgi:hypothetical protein